MHYRTYNREKGTVLLVSLLLLLILSIIGIAGMSTSIFGLRMAGNIQSLYDSFQVADAGRAAAMADPANFDTDNNDDPDLGNFKDILKELDDDELAVNVVRVLPDEELECPRSSAASSVTFIGCEYYTVDSEHDNEMSGAHTKVVEGAVKEILAH